MSASADTKAAKRHANTFDEVACVQGCVQQKMAFQQQFYTHFYPIMMSTVYRYTNDKDEAVSILNNGFLRVFKNIGSFKFEGSLEGWVRRIIIHSVSDYFRYKKLPQEIFKEDLPEQKTINEVIECRFDYNILLQLLNQLPESTRLVINLFIVDGFGHKEIAQMLGITENTSKWHVNNGRKILQEKLMNYK